MNATEKLKARIPTANQKPLDLGEPASNLTDPMALGTHPQITEEQRASHLEEQKAQKKFMFQFINHEDGNRSKPFIGSWDTITEVLEKRKEGEKPGGEDYILLVAVLDGEETIIPATPIIKVSTFMQFSKDKNGVNTNE